MSAITSKLFSQDNSLCFDSHVKKLGDKAIIVTNSREFFRRIEIAVQANNFLRAYPGTGGQASGLVQYVDFDSYNGSIGPFVKSKEYSFQNEWRLALVDSRDNLENYPDHLTLRIGDLTDITLAVDTDVLIQRGFKLVWTLLAAILLPQPTAITFLLIKVHTAEPLSIRR